MLELVSVDGRAIKVEGLPRPEVINSRDLTTHGYLKMVSRNFGQYDLTQNETVLVPLPPLTEIPSTSVLNEIPTNTFMSWSSASSGFGGGITTSISSIVNQGSLDAVIMGANNPSFTSKFSTSYPTLHYQTPSSSPPQADILSTLTFSSPLPIGSKLYVVDVDQGNSFTMTSAGNPLTLINQIQTNDVITAFPSYDPTTGNLTSATGLHTNREASIFDLSNLSTIDVHFQNGLDNTDTFLAISLPNSSPNNPSIGFEEVVESNSIVKDKELLRLCDVDVTTFDDAQISIEIVDASLQNVDKIRSNLGSAQNQLESTIANISVTQVQVASSESEIRDLDFVDESRIYSKLNVLQQSGIYALSQANTSKENLINLLQ